MTASVARVLEHRPSASLADEVATGGTLFLDPFLRELLHGSR
jgi:hypothetical protein